LLDESVGIVSLGGKAPATALALCAGLEAVLERAPAQGRGVPPAYAVAVGNSVTCRAAKATRWPLGAGRVRHPEGPCPWRCSRRCRPRHARGAAADPHPRPSLHDSFVIVDEAQSLERNVLLTVLSTGAARGWCSPRRAQRDNLRVGRHDGVAAVIEKLKGHPLFAHITLMRSERSPIAALVTEMLEEISPNAPP
jgi:PhoH-like ATPase